jgi:PKD repeat protein
MRWDTAGIDTVWVTATNSSGCKDSARFIITIDNLPDANWAVSTSGIAYKFKATDSLQAHYSWKFGDGNTDSGYSVSHTYAKNTTYRVTLTVRNNTGCTTSYDSLINVTVSGLDEQAGSANGLKIYPNPFSNFTNISYHLDKASQVTIEIQDLEGRRITELVNGLQPAGNQNCQFNAGKFNCVPGVYLVKMIIADQVTIQRIVRVN